ncbi:hypothetical protein BpHYR1_027529, partial [Brachionus plicatilis]
GEALTDQDIIEVVQKNNQNCDDEVEVIDQGRSRGRVEEQNEYKVALLNKIKKEDYSSNGWNLNVKYQTLVIMHLQYFSHLATLQYLRANIN